MYTCIYKDEDFLLLISQRKPSSGNVFSHIFSPHKFVCENLLVGRKGKSRLPVAFLMSKIKLCCIVSPRC